MARTKLTEGQVAQKAPRAARGGKSALVPPKSVRKPHKWRAGTVAIREIKRYQHSTEHLIPRAPFKRLAREVIHSFNDQLKVRGEALEALLESAEVYLVQHFERTQSAAVHAGRITIYPKDSRHVTNMAKSLGVTLYDDQMLTDADKGVKPFGRASRTPKPAQAGAVAVSKKTKKAIAAANNNKKKKPVADDAEDGDDAADEPAEAEGGAEQEFDDTG